MSFLVGILLSVLQQQEPPAERVIPEGSGARPRELFTDRTGPFSTGTFSPLASFRSGFAPHAPTTLARDGFEARITNGWADLWAFNEDDWRIDYEGVRTHIALTYGIAHSTFLSLEADNFRRDAGGALGSLIVNVHETLGAEQRHRDEYPTGEVVMRLPAHDDEPALDLDEEDLDETTQSVLLTLERRFGRPHDPTLFSVAISARVETENVEVLHGGSPVDLALSLAVSHRFGDFTGYLSLNLAWFGNEDLEGLELRPLQPSGLAAIEWRCLPKFSLVFQYLLTGGLLEDLTPFTRPSSELAFGFKWEIHPGVVLEVAAIENLIIPDNSPDFGCQGGLTFRW